MPSSSAVHEQLTDILVRVVGCRADDVVPEARLADLGTDSLTILEVGEELGRRFDVYLSDETIDSMHTVKDAVDAVVRHDGSRGPADLNAASGAVPTAAPPPRDKGNPVKPQDTEDGRDRVGAFVAWFAFVGLVIGAVIGIGGAALVSATGIDDVDLPPLSAPTTPEPAATTAEPTTPPPTSTTETPEPTIDASSTSVGPGERFILSGTFPGSDAGEQLQVEVREEGTDWDDFPIEPETRDGGTFKTELYTSRTGEREFRVKNEVSNLTTPVVKVSIG